MKLATWNIQWGRGVDGRVDLARTVADAQRLAADADVLCLQEVSDGFDTLAGCDGSNQFEQLAALLPGWHAVEGVACDRFDPATGRRRRFGNLVLSRLPVRRVLRHLLPWPDHPGVMSMPRLALEVTLDWGGSPLRVTCTHLEYYSAVQRMAQVDRLRALHRDAVAQSLSRHPGTAADGPFEPIARGARAILVGDCNFRPDDPEHARLVADIDAHTPPYRDAWTLAHPDRPHAPTVGVHDRQQWPEPPFTFDFAFVSADLVNRVRDVTVDGRTAASDHQPLLLELD